MTFENEYEGKFTPICDRYLCKEIAIADFTNEDNETQKLCMMHFKRKASYFSSHGIPYGYRLFNRETE